MAQQNKLDLSEEQKKSSKSVVFIVLGTVSGTLVAVFAALYLLGIVPPQHRPVGDAEARELPMIYFTMEPAFVVNFKSNPDARLLQLGLSVASRNQAVIDTVKKHSPMIRNNVLLLLSAEEPAALRTAEGKEALRAELLKAINGVVLKQTGYKQGAEEVYFTAFIMQ
ncbi:flagellar basal body-associated FliL family protein [Methylocaldum szegediense]|jgi:flagellar FliL protein|uniref:Flagellar protein FliL n=1 Tax=Methylocaldum szegediense TaxID=73780 RepID=A0ABN8X9Z9_9GAMM|nr:flagellar basal body-associated FliL family protein [Methylocaldum szegediense]CAI8931089.1 flagellar FliL protein [Methylocaldum szegediense]